MKSFMPMIKKIVKAALTGGLVMSLFLCGCGRTVGSEIRPSGINVEGYMPYDGYIRQIRLEGLSATLNISAENSGRITYTVDDNIVGDLDISVRNGLLRIRRSGRENWHGDTRHVVINIGTDALEEIDILGVAEINGDGVFHADAFVINVTGVVDIDLEINAGSVDIDISGVGNANIGINAQRVTLDLSGVGSIALVGVAEDLEIINSGVGSTDARNLIAQNVRVTNNGIGSDRVYAVQTLEINASGMGSVTYWGEASANINRAGLASVNRGD